MTKKESYTQLKAQLDEVMYKLRNESIGVDEALVLHDEGKKILAKLDAYLSTIEAKIDDQK
jgi:exodeoxyribonuclease VII small subunit